MLLFLLIPLCLSYSPVFLLVLMKNFVLITFASFSINLVNILAIGLVKLIRL